VYGRVAAGAGGGAIDVAAGAAGRLAVTGVPATLLAVVVLPTLADGAGPVARDAFGE
jgi:hypothetical protein